ncbi:dihydrofolate reductase family protein [Cohnella ginsengisoli]|uniref:Dihydrofolate reductase family protein n=1 Tax=Cohnella ginsengisoli TaxID=425004 RepID=A0A9X4QMW1_9BACL|nr:dihydrofolate reductase family protein [Cohnella ginsengisoli]MDG0792514.1 dihydrofolate reductase family protein [Cohnella ginsengisoli]
MAGNGGGGRPFADLDIVVVSASAKELPGATIADTPQEALDYLRGKGHSTALLSGGGALHQAFLRQGLVDELIFNIAPVLEGKGMNILLDYEKYTYQDVTLIESKPFEGGVVQLKYALAR